MATYIRLTDYKDSESKKDGFFKLENRYSAKQEDFAKIPGCPIAYWVSDKIKGIFEKSEKLSDIAEPRQGMATGDNLRFIRLWYELNFNEIGFNLESVEFAHKSLFKWFPFNKGGEFRKWSGNYEYTIIFNKKNYNALASMGNNLPSKQYYFKKGITWSAIASGNFSVRKQALGTIFSNAGMCMFPSNSKFLYFISFLNSNALQILLKTISQTINYNAGDIKNLPIIFPVSPQTKQTIDDLTKECINISKEEWDSHETSWDFSANELVRIKRENFKDDCKIEDVYESYKAYWEEKFFALHVNEERLNKIFIKIYDLEDELDSKVDLKDITILKNEVKIIDEKLEFQADEVIKQLISYAVGVMLGRYSLDKDGLIVANLDEDYPKDTSYKIDDDNIIPVLEDDYFKDDLTSRFIEFVKLVFGEKYLSENINFLELSLGVNLRRYFVKDFFIDHTKRYKKRPIYWMISSKDGGFNALFYLHRYKIDIFARVQNSYLHEYIAKLESAKEMQTHIKTSQNSTNKDKKDADKTISNIDKKLKEIIKFDRENLSKFAQNQIKIDLDDGVRINYCKFSEILYTFDRNLCKRG